MNEAESMSFYVYVLKMIPKELKGILKKLIVKETRDNEFERNVGVLCVYVWIKEDSRLMNFLT